MAAITPYPIETHIPVPQRRAKAPRPAKNGRCPFATLEIGASFFVPLASTGCKDLKKLKSSISTQSLHYPAMRFTMLAYEAEQGVRVWRIA